MIINVAKPDDIFVYHCNGETDNINLKTFIANLQSNGFKNFTVKIEGKFGATDSFTVGDSSGNITLDFSNCRDIVVEDTFLTATNCTIRNLKLTVFGGDSIIALKGVNSTFEHCTVAGMFAGGACYVYELTASKMFDCDCDMLNSDTIFGIKGTDSIVQGCRIKVVSVYGSAYGINMSGTFVSDSFFEGKTDATTSDTSGNGGVGGGHFSNCQFIGTGGLKGYGFFVVSGYWLTMINCVARGYTKSSSTSTRIGAGITGDSNDATTISLLGMNCNQVALSGFTQTKSLELLSGHGVYSGTFFMAPNVGTNIVSHGSYVRNRT